MVQRIIATGGDAGYFPLIDELCASVRALRSADIVGLAVIDGGLEPDQARHLTERYGARILDVDWGYDIHPSRVQGRPHLKVLTARSYLDQHLPDCETVVWVDGDAWVQDMAAVDMMVGAAQKGRLAIVSETSRYSGHTMRVEWAAFGYAQVKSQFYKNIRRAGLGEALARRMGSKPVMNAGVFALNRDAPHWAAWRARIADVIRKGRVFTSDQLALGLVIHEDGLPVELAPDVCNYRGPWTCSDDEQTLVEAYMPNDRVGVVHMAGLDELRRDRALTVPIKTVDGRTVDKSLRYFAWAKT